MIVVIGVVYRSQSQKKKKTLFREFSNRLGETDHIIFIQSDLAVSDQESFGFHNSVYRNHFFPNLAPEYLWRYQSVINITDSS